MLRPERDDPVGHSGLRRRPRLFVAVLAYPEGGHGKGREQCGEAMEELPEGLSVLRERCQRLEAVDRDDPRPPLLDQCADPLGHGGEPALVADYPPEVLEIDRPADGIAIEEAQ